MITEKEIKVLLKDVLNAPFGKPRMHPNGFIQINLNQDGSLRFHVWDDNPLPKQKTDNTIHDHVFDMHSTVLIGKLEHITFNFEVSSNGLYQVYTANYKSKENSILEASGIIGNLKEVGRSEVTNYHFPAFEFHDSKAYGLTATIMRKEKSYEGTPRILCPVGVPPDNSFNRDSVDETILWEPIIKVLKTLSIS